MTDIIDYIRSASIGGQMISVGGTPDSRIAAVSAPDSGWRTPEGGPMPQGNGPRLSRELLKLLQIAKIQPPGPEQMLSLAEVDAALAAAHMEICDRMTVKSALSDLGMIA